MSFLANATQNPSPASSPLREQALPHIGNFPSYRAIEAIACKAPPYEGKGSYRLRALSGLGYCSHIRLPLID